MPTIDSDKEAQAVAQLVQTGQLTGAARDDAMRALREYEASSTLAKMRDVGPHPFRTLVRAARGVSMRQLATDEDEEAIKTVGKGVARSPLTFAEEAGQLMQEVASFYTGDEEGLRQYNEGVKMLREQSDPETVAVSELAAEAPFMATPRGMLTRARGLAPTTLKGAIGANAAIGALGGTMEFNESDDLGDKAVAGLMAGVGGGAGSALMAAIPSGANVVRRMVTETRAKNPNYVKMVERAEEAVPGGFTLAQYSGVPYLAALQLAAYNTPTVVRLANQSRSLVAKYVQDMAKITGGTDNIATARNAFDEAKRGFDDARHDNWLKAELSAAAKEVESGGKVKINVSNLNKATQEIANMLSPASSADRITNRFTGMRLQSAIEESPTMREAITRLAADTKMGAVGPGRFSEILKTTEEINDELTRLIDRGDIIMTEDQRGLVMKTLRDAADADYAALAKQSKVDPSARFAHEAAGEIIAARQSYRLNSDILESMRNGFEADLFGEGASTTQAYSRFTQYPAKSQVKIVNWLEANSPGMIDDFKNEAVRKAAMAATDLTKAGPDAPIDHVAFQKAIKETMHLPIWSADELRRMNRTIDAVRVIQTSRPEFGGTRSAVGAGEVAPVAVSRSPIFAARIIARAMTGSKAADLMLDPVVYNGLLAIKKTIGMGQAAMREASIQLAQYVQARWLNKENEQPEQ